MNIGCGSNNAYDKRPHYDLLAPLVTQLQQRHGFTLVLTGAAYEAEINREFLAKLNPVGPVVDLAGRTDLLELTGAIAACRLFISMTIPGCNASLPATRPGCLNAWKPRNACSRPARTRPRGIM